MSWMDTPTKNVERMSGGASLLPEGTRNYTITAASPEVNQFRKLRELVVHLSSADGSGTGTIALEPWSDDEAALDLFKRVVVSSLEGIGIEMEETIGQTLRMLPNKLPAVIGNVIEANVKHTKSTKLKDDGTPFINAKVYFNKVIQKAQESAASVAASSDFSRDNEFAEFV